MIAPLARARLINHRITHTSHREAADVVEWLGAVQAQEYAAAKWAIGLRMRGRPHDTEIEQTIADGRILRTHVLRPTWHFVAATDIHWLLRLTAPRVRQAMASYTRAMELDARTLSRCFRILERALRDGYSRTRRELGERLQRIGGEMTGSRLAGVMLHAELERLICSGPRRGGQFTYALLAERAPEPKPLARDEALATLCQRYFNSHGPATIRDFVWWSGLKTADARRAVEMIAARPTEVEGLRYWTVDQPRRRATRPHRALLLPIYDEYLVAYRDREAVPHFPAGLTRDSAAFQHSILINGQVAGTWRPIRTRRGLLLRAVLLRRVSPRERSALAEAVERYESFTEVPVDLFMEEAAKRL